MTAAKRTAGYRGESIDRVHVFLSGADQFPEPLSGPDQRWVADRFREGVREGCQGTVTSRSSNDTMIGMFVDVADR